MKRTAVLILMAVAAVSAMADLIVTVDGKSMEVYNVQTSQKWLFYTETDAEDADIKKIPIDRVFAYKIDDGPMTTVGAAPAAATEPQTAAANPAKSGKLDPVPAADNEALIAAYNNHPQLSYIGKKPQPDKYTKTFISLWGIEEGSILSDENVEIGFEKVYKENDKNHSVAGTRIKVINKTDAPIYIDLASCYKIMNGGYSMPYFTNSVYSEGSGHTTGSSLNIGAVTGALGIGGVLGTLANGINVGSSNTRSASITTAEQQIITIPPHSLACLPGEKFSSGEKIVECYDPIYFYNSQWSENDYKTCIKLGEAEHMTIGLDQKNQKILDNPTDTSKSLGVKNWMQTDFTPETSPKKIGRIITYSTSPDFSTYTSLPVKLYMRGAFGLNMLNIDLDCVRAARFDDKNFEGITDKEHFIVGRGFVKSK